jgi:8-oxo-dGTP pyrophosphatase MutT (NUDIX family)
MPQRQGSTFDFATTLGETWTCETRGWAYLTQTSGYSFGYGVYSKPSNEVVSSHNSMSPYLSYLRSKIGHDLLLLPSVAAVIKDGEGRILLQEKSSGEGWSLPAGAIEPGETPEQAICREVREETGLLVKAQEIIGVFGGSDFRYIYPNGDEVEYIAILYRCVPTGISSDPLDSETKSLRYFGESEMPKLALPYPASAFFPA